MEFDITGDTTAQDRVGEAIDSLNGPTDRYYRRRHYGRGLRGVCVVLMCQDPRRLHLKRRVRFVKKTKTLYMDIMLDWSRMIRLNRVDTLKAVLEIMPDEVEAILRKYAFKDFDEQQFMADLRAWLHAFHKIADKPQLMAGKSDAVVEHVERLMAKPVSRGRTPSA